VFSKVKAQNISVNTTLKVKHNKGTAFRTTRH